MADSKKESTTPKSGLGQRMQDVYFEILPPKDDKRGTKPA